MKKKPRQYRILEPKGGAMEGVHVCARVSDIQQGGVYEARGKTIRDNRYGNKEERREREGCAKWVKDSYKGEERSIVKRLSVRAN